MCHQIPGSVTILLLFLLAVQGLLLSSRTVWVKDRLEEMGETGQHLTGVLAGANTSSASSSCKPLHHSNSLNCI